MDPFPAERLTSAGAEGTPMGVTGGLANEAGPDPPAFDAVTVKVYAVPSVSPVTAQKVVAAEQDSPPGEAVAVYEVTDEPPSSAGAVQ
jgi:hypothetical protein